jgi:exonuclease VII small subunit
MRSPLLSGVLNPLNMLMLGLAIFAGLLAAWQLFPVGLVLWLVMVLAVARSPALQLNHKLDSREPVAGRFSQKLDRIQRMQVRLFNAIGSASPAMRRSLKPLQNEINALTEQAYVLCLRMTPQENYRITSQSAAQLRVEREHYTGAVKLATDEQTRRKYGASLQALEEKIDRLQSITTELEQVDALLDSVGNELEVALAEISQVQALGAEAASDRIPAVAAKLHSISVEVRSFGKRGVVAQTA